MTIRWLSLLFSLLLLSACTMTLLEENLREESTAPTPPTAEPQSGISVEPLAIIDDFSSISTSWQAGKLPNYSDSSALNVALSMEHSRSGGQTLAMTFDHSDLPKGVFFVERDRDLSAASYLHCVRR